MELSDIDLFVLIGVLDFIDKFTNKTVEPLPLDNNERDILERLKAEQKRRKDVTHGV